MSPMMYGKSKVILKLLKEMWCIMVTLKSLLKVLVRNIIFEKLPLTDGVQYRWYKTLEGMGFTVVPFGQGFKDMSPPTKELMKLTLEEKLAHGGHPVLEMDDG
jgi:hypothetical protein